MYPKNSKNKWKSTRHGNASRSNPTFGKFEFSVDLRTSGSKKLKIYYRSKVKVIMKEIRNNVCREKTIRETKENQNNDKNEDKMTYPKNETTQNKNQPTNKRKQNKTK